MSKELMNIKYQITSEENTQLTTQLSIPGWFSNYPAVLDSLFEAAYFIGDSTDPTSAEGHFYSLGYQNLVQFPYTVRATCILIEKGFYFEAISLVRNLYESFFQLRYFHKHKDVILTHWKKKKPKVLIKTMFEEISPNFYDQIYGKEFSTFAHSGLGSSIFRTSYTSPEVGETILGNKYDEAGSSYSINKIIVVLFGILNYIPILFPQYSSLVTEISETKRKASLAWLESVMKRHIADKPDAKEFYDLAYPLIYI